MTSAIAGSSSTTRTSRRSERFRHPGHRTVRFSSARGTDPTAPEDRISRRPIGLGQQRRRRNPRPTEDAAAPDEDKVLLDGWKRPPADDPEAGAHGGRRGAGEETGDEAGVLDPCDGRRKIAASHPDPPAPRPAAGASHAGRPTSVPASAWRWRSPATKARPTTASRARSRGSLQNPNDIADVVAPHFGCPHGPCERSSSAGRQQRRGWRCIAAAVKREKRRRETRSGSGDRLDLVAEVGHGCLHCGRVSCRSPCPPRAQPSGPLASVSRDRNAPSHAHR